MQGGICSTTSFLLLMIYMSLSREVLSDLPEGLWHAVPFIFVRLYFHSQLLKMDKAITKTTKKYMNQTNPPFPIYIIPIRVFVLCCIYWLHTFKCKSKPAHAASRLSGTLNWQATSSQEACFYIPLISSHVTSQINR